MDPKIQALGMVIHSPWSVVTNLLLAVGALFGALKHGFPGAPGHDAIRFASNLGLGLAVTSVQLATIRAQAPSAGSALWLERLALLQCVIFLGFSFRTRAFVVPGMQLAVGMAPILLAVGWRAAGGAWPNRWIATVAFMYRGFHLREGPWGVGVHPPGLALRAQGVIDSRGSALEGRVEHPFQGNDRLSAGP
jgi:hypothetical protein